MTPRDHARKFYGAQWNDLLDDYVARHFVYASPTCLVLARDRGDSWFIEFLAGDMKEALNHLPHWKPMICFNRRGKPKSVWTATLVNKLLRSVNDKGNSSVNDSAENGFVDPPARWGRWRATGKTTTGSISNNCG